MGPRAPVTIPEGLSFSPPGPGVWQRDEDHWPRPVPASYTELYADAVIPYVREWTSRYGLLIDYFESRFPNGFGYGCVHPVGEPKKGASGGPPPRPVFKTLLKVHPELRARRRAAERALRERLWLADLQHWDRDAKPAVIAENRANAAVDRQSLDEAELVEHVERCRATLRHFIGLHHRFNGALLPVGMLMASAREWFGDERAPLALLEGASPVSSGRSPELDHLVAAINDDPAAAAALGSDDEPAEVLARLAGCGGAVAAAFSEYREVVGHRLVGDSIEPGNPTLIEVPDVLVNTLRVACESSEQGHLDAVATEQAAELRARVPAAQRPEFDRLLEDTWQTYRMRDERSVYVDVWAAGTFRLALIELGRRLAARGRLHEPVHLVEATADEVRSLVDGAASLADELADRARFRVEHAGLRAPAVLGGEPPVPPPVEWLPAELARVNEALMIQIASFFDAPATQVDTPVLAGRGASAGRYEGTARVVSGPEDFGRIQPGDVLVARTTSEAFNVVLPLLGAIVTDRGGVLSHAAIVSRESGIPCVVGTGEATSRITDGSHVLVEGSTGEVRLR